MKRIAVLAFVVLSVAGCDRAFGQWIDSGADLDHDAIQLPDLKSAIFSVSCAASRPINGAGVIDNATIRRRAETSYSESYRYQPADPTYSVNFPGRA